MRTGSMAAVAVAFALLASIAGMGTSSAETVTFMEQVTIPVAPASDCASSGGGDGYDVSLTPEAVYNVYHHNPDLRVACHKQVDASNCWTSAFKVVQDGSGNNFGTSNQSSTVIDQGNGHLYIYGTRSSDQVRGVVCVDTTLPADATDLFCGFTVLGDATAIGSSGSPTAGVDIGTKFYAFNYAPIAGVAGTANTLMCFDMASQSGCATPNYDVGLPAGSTNGVPSTSISAVGTRVYVPLAMSTGSWLACFDTTTGATCGGAWPVQLPAPYQNGAPVPMLSTDGAIIGVCLPDTNEWCYTLTGAAAAAPPGFGAAMGTTNYYNALPLILEDRVYIASWEGDTVRCYDFGSQQQCPNFPLAMQDAGLVYTVNADPQRPACLWINADNGDAQIQNFDAFSGESCGAGAIRVLASAVVPPGAECTPVDWTTLQVLDPLRSAYTTGTVAFRNSDGGLIPGATDATLDDTGSADLTNQPLAASRPQFLIALEGLGGPIGEVTIELTWTGENLEQCGQEVVVPPADAPPADAPPPGSPPPGSPPPGASGPLVVPRFAG
jgi:outer membrane protein assembly factor BamB